MPKTAAVCTWAGIEIKKICSNACERRDESTVEFVAERDRVALGGDGGDLMALFGYY